MAKQRRTNVKTQAARIELINLSNEVRQQAALLAAITGKPMTVNEGLLMTYKIETGCKTFKTFHQWKADGYRVKKGVSSFRVWGSPINAKTKEAATQTTEQGEEAKQYEYWPMCSLFNESQVEPLDSEPTPVEGAESATDVQEGPGETETTDTAGEGALCAQALTDSPFVVSNYQERLEDRAAYYEDKARAATASANATHQRARDMASVIPFGQPILVGHHSEQRDRRYRDKIHTTYGKAFEQFDKADHYQEKAQAVGKGGIASDDPEALTKLKTKLASCQQAQERMKAANRALRKNDDQALAAQGFNEQQIADLKKPDFAGRAGFPDYALTNNNAEIRRLKDRIKELETLYNREPVSFENDDFMATVDEGRILFDFKGGKPSEAARRVMKSGGFRFSRYRGMWTRKATHTALNHAQLLIDELTQLDSIY